MQIYITLTETDEFVGVSMTQEDAENKMYDEDCKVIPYELVASPDELEEASNKTTLGYCFICDKKLTKEDVWYDEDNKPFCCHKCADGRYY